MMKFCFFITFFCFSLLSFKLHNNFRKYLHTCVCVFINIFYAIKKINFLIWVVNHKVSVCARECHVLILILMNDWLSPCIKANLPKRYAEGKRISYVEILAVFLIKHPPGSTHESIWDTHCGVSVSGGLQQFAGP